ncbi:unnamed protein product [Medioppia subpectinata]|uniref:Uncharacterized protein n=1 Tax=Medioppia subpectinata TaxID=1979941 RepID=A0A7R9KUU3_9ACAR|nr:unnamed protein product [Medioppia subpectinata]CAG2109074.1 unnamed protein product [Medioppia subpectinata]
MGNCINGNARRPQRGLPSIPSRHYEATNGSTYSSTYSSTKSVSRKASNGPKQKIVIALYSYEGRDEGELSFEKGDKLVIIDDKEPDWWLAKRITSDRAGYIPMNFVVMNIIETEEWFFSKTSRREAEKLLLLDDYPRGTFLVRDSEQKAGLYKHIIYT